MSYIAKPSPCYLDEMEKYRVISGRQVYRMNDKFYSWDELHGEIFKNEKDLDENRVSYWKMFF